MRTRGLAALPVAVAFAVVAFAVVASATAGLLAGQAWAQSFPHKPITFVVPFAAGGSVDPLARVIGERMATTLGQPLIVLNRPGAGGTLGAEAVVRADPDGHTLLIGSTALATSPALYPKLSFDLDKDLAPISMLVGTPNVLVVRPGLPARSVVEVVALAKAKPGVLTSASAGVGSSNHLSLELFKVLAGVDILHVPYRGAAPAVSDVLAGHVDMTFVPAPAAVSFIESGKLTGLAVTSATRSTTLPTLPTIAEAGVPGFDASSWIGMLAPGATPPPVIARLHEAIVEALHDPGVLDVLSKAGAEPVGNAPAAFAVMLRDETAKWSRVIKPGSLKPE